MYTIARAASSSGVTGGGEFPPRSGRETCRLLYTFAIRDTLGQFPFGTPPITPLCYSVVKGRNGGRIIYYHPPLQSQHLHVQVFPPIRDLLGSHRSQDLENFGQRLILRVLDGLNKRSHVTLSSCRDTLPRFWQG